MPELPDLEAIKSVLEERVLGLRIQEVEVGNAIPIRRPGASEFASSLKGNAFTKVERRGKFLLMGTASGHVLAVNPMLTGRFQYCPPSGKRRAKTCFVLQLEDGQQLRYFDSRVMGKVYLVPHDELDSIPGFEVMGPEAMSDELNLEEFRARLRRHPGIVKNILLNSRFIAGIGNAYADEILFRASIYPYRRRVTLSGSETEHLYVAVSAVLVEAKATVRARMGEAIHIKIRDFLQVHGKGGQPCPRCGHTISQITANKRLTNFCRGCQK
ncbi:MAG: Fpg/Nei family glycosylase [Dehalococcoidia bacterium]|nr:Fpg/Nei family glycosylase [Dehalococcoidia bacterium]